MAGKKDIGEEQRCAIVKAQFDKLFKRIEKGYADHTATYISIPVTSGRRLFGVLNKYGLPLALDDELLRSRIHLYEVIKPNITAAKRHIRKLSLDGLVIDPTDVCIRGASQKDYRDFWKKVITKKAARVIIALDWAFSFGCLYEIGLAFGIGLPIFDSFGKCLNKKEIEKRIKDADHEVEEYGFAGCPLMKFWRICEIGGLS
jgi:hypothetical protein